MGAGQHTPKWQGGDGTGALAPRSQAAPSPSARPCAFTENPLMSRAVLASCK